MSKSILALATIFACAMGMAACEQEGGAERAGEQIDRAVDKTGDAMKNAAGKPDDRIEKATD